MNKLKATILGTADFGIITDKCVYHCASRILEYIDIFNEKSIHMIDAQVPLIYLTKILILYLKAIKTYVSYRN